MTLFNFHTHDKSKNYGIINIFPGDEIIAEKKYSCGLHPWNYSESYNKDLSIIEVLAKENKLVAIGETGFDPKSPVEIDLQTKIFLKHVEISEKYKLPLIIHCVKYFHVLTQLKNEIKPQQALIIHGFNSKISLLQNLVKAGFYFSVSGNLLKNTKKSAEFFAIAPINKIFIETDDSCEDINELYNFAATYLGLGIEDFAAQVNQNLKDIGI
jgi:TatD DNase family protein